MGVWCRCWATELVRPVPRSGVRADAMNVTRLRATTRRRGHARSDDGCALRTAAASSASDRRGVGKRPRDQGRSCHWRWGPGWSAVGPLLLSGQHLGESCLGPPVRGRDARTGPELARSQEAVASGEAPAERLRRRRRAVRGPMARGRSSS
jgi:hypothetical protein